MSSMACPTHSCSAEHINMPGEKKSVDENLFQLLAIEKNGNEGNCCQTIEGDGARNPLQIAVKPCFRRGAVLMRFRGHFQTIDVHKKLERFKDPWHVSVKNVAFVRGLEPPGSLVV